MKIECPFCKTAFSVPDNALGEKGRKLKCKTCEHIWFQGPIKDQKKEIPKAVEFENEIEKPSIKQDFIEEISENKIDDQKKKNEESVVEEIKLEPAPEEFKIENEEISESSLEINETEIAATEDVVRERQPFPKKQAILAAVLLLFCILTGMLTFRSHLTFMAKITNLIGIMDGNKIIIKGGSVYLKKENNKLSVTIEGAFLNPSKEEQKLPPIRVSFYTSGGNMLVSDYIRDQPIKSLKAGESYPFTLPIKKISGSATKMSVDIADKWEMNFR